MCADAETLPDHEPLSEVAVAEKVVIGRLHAAAGEKADDGDGGDVAGEDDPVECSDVDSCRSELPPKVYRSSNCRAISYSGVFLMRASNICDIFSGA